jgi:hypothetical protein
MSQQKQASIHDSMQLIQTFLSPIRAQAEKEASMKQAAEDGSSSFKDTKAANPEEQEKQEAASTSQTNLGKEQSTLAAENLPTPAPTAKPNSEADAAKPTDDQGTKTLMVDQKADVGPVVQQEISQEQKMARAENLANGILNILAYGKEASDSGQGAAVDGEAGGSKVGQQPGGQNPKVAPQAPARIPNDLDGKAEGGEKTAAFMGELDKTAALAAQDYFEAYRFGLLKRAQDELEVEAAGIDPSILAQFGGVQGLLDKVAEEFPEAVLPEEAMGGAMPMPGPDAAMGGEMPMPPEAMGGEGVPGEGAPGEGGPDLETMAAALDEAGVTPEELQQAMEDVQALQEAGIPPEELANALSQVVDEGGAEGGMEPGEAAEAGEGAGEEPGEAAEDESPAEEAAEEEKEASMRYAAKVREILSR